MAGGSLSEYLAQAARTPWSWEGINCLTFAADWVVIARGLDPAAQYRFCKSENECLAALRAVGGMRRMVVPAMAALGLQVTQEPKAGDVALVFVPTEVRRRSLIVGAICVGSRQFAVKTSDMGLVISGPPGIRPINKLIWSLNG